MATTTRIKPLRYFVPFSSGLIERADVQAVLGKHPDAVPGYAFVNETVDGEGGVRLKRSAMEAATPDYLQFCNIREMHDRSAVGTCVHSEWDERGWYIVSDIVDPIAKLKCERGVYKGYSVGVQPLLMRGKDVETCKIVEISLVDRPKDPDAMFTTYRAEGFDPDTEVEVELLPAGDEGLEVARKSDADEDDYPSPNTRPPSSDDFEIEEDERGVFCLYGPERAPLGEFPTRAEAEARRDEIIADFKDGDGSHDNDATDQQQTAKVAALVTDTKRALEADEAIRIQTSEGGWRVIRAADESVVAEGEDTQELVSWIAEAVKRAQTSATAPSRESLEGKAKGLCPDCGEPLSECRCMDRRDTKEREKGNPANDAPQQIKADSAEEVNEKIEEESGKPRPSQMDEDEDDETAEPETPSKKKAKGQKFPVQAKRGEEDEENSPTITRLHSLERENGDLLERLNEANAELSRVREAKEEFQRLLASAEAEVLRLENMPPTREPVMHPRALAPEFFANLRLGTTQRKAEIELRLGELTRMEPTRDYDEQQRRVTEMMLLKAERSTLY